MISKENLLALLSESGNAITRAKRSGDIISVLISIDAHNARRDYFKDDMRHYEIA